MLVPEILLILILLLYSIPLGIIFIFYCSFISVYRSKKKLITDIIISIGFLLYIYYKRDLIDISAIVHQPQYIWHTYKQGIMLGLRTDWHSWHQIYTHGLFSVLLLAMFFKCILSYLNYRSAAINLKTRDLKQQQSHKKLLANGTLLSQSYGEDIVITDQELNQHCLIIGTTGAGKTTTILNIVDSAASRKLPCIYLDGKGSPELVDKLRIIANKHNRQLKVFTLRPNMNIPETAYYNPFSSGTATEWKNRIMSLFAEAQGKGQEHFSLAEQNYINFVSNVLHGLSQKENQSIDLKILLTFLENRDLLIAAANKVDSVMATKLDNLHNDANNKHMAADVVKLLELFIYSSYGHLFDTDEKTNIINLHESILNGEIVLFLFDASAYLEDTKKIAKMVINDINSCFASFEKFTPAFCIFDEFASYASSNLSETISLQRSKGLHAIIGTQSIASVKLKSIETRRVAEELIACCNTYIIQMLNHNEDAELFAKVIGTREQMRYTTTMYDRDTSTSDSPKSLGSAQLVDKYIISPQQIKDLRQGEAILYRKAAHKAPIKIKIKSVFN